MTPSIYLSLEDDVAKVVSRLKKEKADKVVLVCPKRCFLFNDSINLRLLKKQVDLLKKQVFVLTMDERGQAYAKEAGFELKFLPKTKPTAGVSDIAAKPLKHEVPKEPVEQSLVRKAKEITNFAKFWNNNAAEEEEVRPKPRTAIAKAAPVASPKVRVTDSIFPKELEEAHKITRKRAKNQRWVTVTVAASLLMVLALFFVVLPRASVVIFPKSEPITRDVEVSVSPNLKQADVSRLVMPAVKIDQTAEVSGKFQSQGKKEIGSKSTGVVQIYNFTRSPLNLKTETTILTVGSKTYRLASDISQLRPTGYKNAQTKEVDESTLAAPVEIIADSGGESFNLPAGTRMEITNQVFGSKPQFLYAKTVTAITGGTSRYLSVVSEQDLASSKDRLKLDALAKLEEGLKAQGLALPEQAYTLEEVRFATDKPVGTESPNFEASLKLRLVGLAYDQQDLQELITGRISQTLSAGKRLYPGEKPMNVKAKTYDASNGLATLAVHFEGLAVYDVKVDNIASELKGKTQNQVNELLQSRAEIERIDIVIVPSWQKHFPWFSGKIDVTTETELVGGN